MSWTRLDLQMGYDEHIDEAWRFAWESAYDGMKPEASNAVFRSSSAGKPPVLYFSPAAAWLAHTFGAEPCTKPPPSGITLIAGDERAWDIYFGGASIAPSHRVAQQPASRFFGVFRARHVPKNEAAAHKAKPPKK